jgi:hypothetical protein
MDLEILQAFYNGTVGTDRWKKGCDDGWGDPHNHTFCTWAGITCTGDKRNVKEIRIAACNLVGEMPSNSQIASVFSLKHVETILISGGPDLYLSGLIPDDFNTENPILATIQLTGHQFRGEIPASLYKSTSLQTIDLHSNGLQGPLSDAIGDLVELEYFSAANNKLDGSLPKAISKLSKLNTLGLAKNSFTGLITPVSDLPNLKILFLRNNLFSGAIPKVTNSTAVLDLDQNQFDSVSDELCEGGQNISALSQPGGCHQDWPTQDLGTCCMASNKFDQRIISSCTVLRNCFRTTPAVTYTCSFPDFKCVPAQASAGRYPSLNGCEAACRAPTPPPTPPTPCTGNSSKLNPLDCSIWQQTFDHTNGSQWTYCSDLRNDPCSCSWQRADAARGINVRALSCDHIYSIDLSQNNLAGALPAAFSKLDLYAL